MIKLYGFGPGFGLSDVSPFVLKVEAYMRFADIAFEKIDGVGALGKSPKGKLPYIEDDGDSIGDSHFIIRHLQAGAGKNLDAGFSEPELAKAHLLTKALDEHFYWSVVYSRWIDEAGWEQMRAALFGGMPPPLRQLVAAFVRRGVKKQLRAQGLTAHSDAEILDMTSTMLRALSIELGEKAWFMGDRPGSVDASAWGMLAAVILADIDGGVGELARQHGNLVAYCQRIQKQF